jgi:apolipoprotein N-acyltransferase
MMAMPGGMALFYAAAAALAMSLWRPGGSRVFALAVAFGLAEFARGHVLTGLPWNLLGYALAPTLSMMQAASIFGVYALSLLAVLLFASPFAIWAPQGSGLARPKGTALLMLVFSIALAFGAAWGVARLQSADTATTGVGLRIAQANVDQANKWRPENSAEIFKTYLDLTKSGGGKGGLDGISLVVWPETAVPFLLVDSSEALAAIGDVLPDGTSLFVGSGRIVDERDAQGRFVMSRVYNSLLVVGDKGEILDAYDKIHLVPFGEYLPMQALLESIGLEQLTRWRGGFSIGVTPRPLLEIPGLPPALGLICYEAVFPAAIVQGGQRPGLLINVTNDGWFGDTTGPWQHFHQTRVRAVEEGLPIIRSANNGVSAIVDGTGRVVAMLTLNARGNLDSGVPSSIAAPVYAKLGDCTFVGLLLIFLGVVFMLYNRRSH